MKLTEDAWGLRFEISLPDTTYANDLLALVKRGDIRGMSFGFVAQVENLVYENDETIRELRDCDLYEISVVTEPAFPQTKVQVRSDVLARIHRPRELYDLIQKHSIKLLA